MCDAPESHRLVHVALASAKRGNSTAAGMKALETYLSTVATSAVQCTIAKNLTKVTFLTLCSLLQTNSHMHATKMCTSSQHDYMCNAAPIHSVHKAMSTETPPNTTRPQGHSLRPLAINSSTCSHHICNHRRREHASNTLSIFPTFHACAKHKIKGRHIIDTQSIWLRQGAEIRPEGQERQGWVPSPGMLCPVQQWHRTGQQGRQCGPAAPPWHV